MRSNDPTDALSMVSVGYNVGYVADPYDRCRADPSSVDPVWRSIFDSAAGFPRVRPATNGDGSGPEAAHDGIDRVRDGGRREAEVTYRRRTPTARFVHSPRAVWVTEPADSVRGRRE